MEADLYEEINVMIQLYLIRHSMTAGNLKKRYIGRTDESLCPEGIVLLESYIQKNIYPEVQRVYVSPMKRCMETAKLIFKENFYEVEELRECDFGIFENKNYKIPSGRIPGRYELYMLLCSHMHFSLFLPYCRYPK